MDDLTNRDWIIVTGAGSGIGFDVAQSLCEKGNGVVAFDFDNEKLKKAFSGRAGSVVYRCLDVRDAGGVSASIDSLRNEVGPIKGLVNCAGVYPVTPF